MDAYFYVITVSTSVNLRQAFRTASGVIEQPFNMGKGDVFKAILEKEDVADMPIVFLLMEKN